MTTKTKNLVCLLSLALLTSITTACGGSGGGSGPTPPATVTPPTTSAVPLSFKPATDALKRPPTDMKLPADLLPPSRLTLSI